MFSSGFALSGDCVWYSASGIRNFSWLNSFKILVDWFLWLVWRMKFHLWITCALLCLLIGSSRGTCPFFLLFDTGEHFLYLSRSDGWKRSCKLPWTSVPEAGDSSAWAPAFWVRLSWVSNATGWPYRGKGVLGPEVIAGYAKALTHAEPMTGTWFRLHDVPEAQSRRTSIKVLYSGVHFLFVLAIDVVTEDPFPLSTDVVNWWSVQPL